MIAGLLPAAPDTMPWRSGLVATALTGCILAYDGFLKKTPLGPLAMGACRFFNLLMAMSAGEPSPNAVYLGYGTGDVTIRDAGCTDKSFPGFWESLREAGL